MSIAIASYNNPQVLAVIKDQICPGATPPEMWQFLARCVALGLDPFSRQIYFIKRQGKVSHQIGIDGFRSVAEDSGELLEISEPEYEGTIQVEGEKVAPELARVTVVREIKGRERPFVGVARWHEFLPASPNDFMWKKMPYHMLGKCAEAQALRRAFPQKLGGLQTDAEAMSAEEVFATTQSMRGTTPQEAIYWEVTDKETGEIKSVRAGDEYVRMMREAGEEIPSDPIRPPATVIDTDTVTQAASAQPEVPERADLDERSAEPATLLSASSTSNSGLESQSHPTPAASDPAAPTEIDYDLAYELWEAHPHVTYPKPMKTATTAQLLQWRTGLLAKAKEAAMT